MRTKKGDTVRILCEDNRGPYPIVGIIGECRIVGWTYKYKCSSDRDEDELVRVNEPNVIWVLRHGEDLISNCFENRAVAEAYMKHAPDVYTLHKYVEVADGP